MKWTHCPNQKSLRRLEVTQFVPQVGRSTCGSIWLQGVYSCKSQSFGTRPGPHPLCSHSFWSSFPSSPWFIVEHRQAQLFHPAFGPDPWALEQLGSGRVFGPRTHCLARRTGCSLLIRSCWNVQGGRWGHKREGTFVLQSLISRTPTTMEGEDGRLGDHSFLESERARSDQEARCGVDRGGSKRYLTVGLGRKTSEA